MTAHAPSPEEIAREIVAKHFVVSEYRTFARLRESIAAALTAAREREKGLEARIAEMERANRTRPDYDVFCADCGKGHIIDTVLPSPVWNQIAEPHELLCTLCIEDRLASAAIPCDVAEFYYAGPFLQSRIYTEATPPDHDAIRRVALEDHQIGTLLTTLAREMVVTPPKDSIVAAHRLKGFVEDVYNRLRALAGAGAPAAGEPT